MFVENNSASHDGTTFAEAPKFLCPADQAQEWQWRRSLATIMQRLEEVTVIVLTS